MIGEIREGSKPPCYLTELAERDRTAAYGTGVEEKEWLVLISFQESASADRAVEESSSVTIFICRSCTWIQRSLIERNMANSRWAGVEGNGTLGQRQSNEKPCCINWCNDSIIRSTSRLTSLAVRPSTVSVSRRPEQYVTERPAGHNSTTYCWCHDRRARRRALSGAAAGAIRRAFFAGPPDRVGQPRPDPGAVDAADSLWRRRAAIPHDAAGQHRCAVQGRRAAVRVDGRAALDLQHLARAARRASRASAPACASSSRRCAMRPGKFRCRS